MNPAKRMLAGMLSFLMVWSLFGYVFPAYSDEIEAWIFHTKVALAADLEDVDPKAHGEGGAEDEKNPEPQGDASEKGDKGLRTQGEKDDKDDEKSDDPDQSDGDETAEDADSPGDSDKRDKDDATKGAGSTDKHDPNDSAAPKASTADDGAEPDTPGDAASDNKKSSEPRGDADEKGDESSDDPDQAGDGGAAEDVTLPGDSDKRDVDGATHDAGATDDSDQRDGEGTAEDAGQLDNPDQSDGDGATEDAGLPDDPAPKLSTESEAPAVFGDGLIHLATTAQLQAIGSGADVTTTDLDEDGFGKGDVVVDEGGAAVVYAADAAYYLDSDINLPKGGAWQLPDGFAGSFQGPEDEDGTLAKRIYDPETDTIYIQNPYQLDILASEGRAEMPVMTGDVVAGTFGSGNLIFPDGSQLDPNAADEEAEDEDEAKATGYLTYDESHNYVLSMTFTAKRGKLKALKAAGMLRAAPTRGAGSNADHVDGRDYFGQVTKEIDGTTYILIGDRQQLDAINNASSSHRTYVCMPVYEIHKERQRTYNSLNVPNGYTSWETTSVKLVYPGDADLVDGVWDGESQQDFSNKPLFQYGTYHNTDRDPEIVSDLYVTGHTSQTIWCPIDPATGKPDESSYTSNKQRVGSLTYEQDGNYIVFRDIDMKKGDASQVDYGTLENGVWKPLMFTGHMYGLKAESSSDVTTLWDGASTQLLADASSKPTIHDFSVSPVIRNQLQSVRLDLSAQTGVGFFGTLMGSFNQSSISDNPVVVSNIRLRNGTVKNPAVKAEIDQTLVSGLVTGLATGLGVVLNPVLSLLLGKDIGLRAMLVGLLDARAKDPSSLATGAFVGRMIGKARVSDCEVENVSVTTVASTYEADGKIVGKGGFVGYVEGQTTYDALSNTFDTLGYALSSILNIIPGVGLGDLITILLDNALPLEKLIPTGYSVPTITGCTVRGGSLSTEAGKYGVGGFAGSVCGTVLTDCAVRDSDMQVRADHFGGGFVGIERDAVIKGTLSGLGIDIGSLHPQSELVDCTIDNSNMQVSGGTYLGGFVGAMANSYGINNTVTGNGSTTVTGTGDYVGGYTGYAHLGTLFGFGSYLEEGESLLSTVKGLVTGLLGSGSDQSLLELGGVAPSAIVGYRNEAPLTVESQGAFVGGIVGRGNGTTIASSTEENLRKLGKYNDKNAQGAYTTALPINTSEARPNSVTQLVSVSAGSGKTDDSFADESFAGGLAGYLTSANVGGLLGSTLGVAQYLGFTVCDTTIHGVNGGYTVTAAQDYAAGGIGWAVGGDVYDVELEELRSVVARNHAAGFVGATGPGDLVSGEGIDLSLLGISLIKVDNLLSLAAGVRTTYERANVTGIDAGFTVEATGRRSGNAKTDFVAGGWAGEANSVRVVDSHVRNLQSVKANMADGRAGGYVGDSSAGGLAGAAQDDTGALNLLSLNNVLNAVPYLIPSYDGCSTTYVDGGYVQADTAGGFAGEFRSGKVNTYATAIKDGVVLPYGWNPISDHLYTLDHEAGYSCGMLSNEPWSVYNLDHVRGGAYAGGWGGRVYSGALASAGEGLSLLSGDGLNLSGLLNVAQAYVPIIYCAGVQGSKTGYQVFAAHEEQEGQPATTGKAGGYIGYGSGVEVSYSDVKYLRSGQPNEPTALTGADSDAYGRIGMAPDALESQDGSNYMSFGDFDDDPTNVPYAVAGVTHAGGYIGHMDVGSAASVGDKLSLLNALNLSDVLSALNSVVSTIEHSDVVQTPGGYSVVASSHVNLGDGAFDDKGVGYAGGFVGQAEGGHIQDANSYNFNYVIGEIAAGGYAGEITPGSVADVLGDNASANLGKLGILDASGLLSLAQDFVPTIRNSETTCVPCGGAVRAEKPSDGTGTQGTASQLRGMAGGYVGHNKGGQIWGMDHRRWKDVDDYPLGTMPIATAGPRECAAVRIRSVYGAEYAGGFCGFMECASTAESGGLSLLGGLVKLDNLVGALQAVYPTIEAGAVYGPLYGMKEDFSEATWNAWRKNIAAFGGFASELAGMSYEQMLNTDWSQYVYGTNVVAGRHEYDPHANTSLAGCAGGFVGAMHGGAISGAELVDELEIDYPCHAEDVKLVLGMRAAGGFAGEMQTKGLAEAGSASVLGIPLNLGNLLGLAQVFVPAISTSGTKGYQKGLRVGATGQSYVNVNNDSAAYAKNVGCAGGYVGACYGGQIGISESTSNVIIDAVSSGDVGGAWVRMLKEVKGTRDIGGFVGKTSSASVVNADTEGASSGFLQSLLTGVVSTPNDLLNVLQSTVATIKYAKVSASDPKWGIVVDGTYRDASGDTAYAETAGGFAGSLEAAVIGERNNELDVIALDGLRSVVGGRYAGGFFGLADVGSVADVGGSGGTSVLNNLVKAGNISALDAFRTYVYHANVTGVADGIRVYAKDALVSNGTMNTYTQSGAAGGFGGALLNGTVENSTVDDLNYIEAPNFAAGFVGHAGKNGGVTADEVSVGGNDSLLSMLVDLLGLDLSAAAKLFDIVGSTITNCEARGFADGYITYATNDQTPASTGQTQDNITGSCSAGFVGFADAAQIDECGARRYKLAQGSQIAGGFVGRTSVAYLADIDVDLTLVRSLLSLLDEIGVMDILYGATSLVPPAIDFGGFELKLLSQGNVLYLDLFGFKLGVSLVRAEAGSGEPDALTIVLGSSTITVPYSREVNDVPVTESDASIQLIEGNRTSIKNSFVKGVKEGYDVFGGNASQDADGSGSLGYAGGFVGFNDNGFFSRDTMALCDVVRGTEEKVGPFVGSGEYATRSQEYLEGTDNTFRIYRNNDGAYTRLQTRGGVVFNTSFSQRNDSDTGAGDAWDRYDVTHYDVIEKHDDLRDAKYAGTSIDPEAYVSSAKAKLMSDTPAVSNGTGDTIEPDELKDPCEELFDLTVNKQWKGDLVGLTGTRPDNITVYVWQVDVGTSIPQTLVAAGLSPSASDEDIVRTYKLQLNAKANGQTHTEAWKARLKDLPVAHMVTVPVLDGSGDPVPMVDEQGEPVYELDEHGERIPVLDDDGQYVLDGTGNPTYQVKYKTEEELHYLRYFVSELQVPEYTTTYELAQDTASVNIVNTYDGSLLPFLGGPGGGKGPHAIVLALAAALLALSAWHLRRLRRRGGDRVNA